jgi:Neuraminidase (sialidase)
MKKLTICLLVLSAAMLHAKEPQKQLDAIPVFQATVDKAGSHQYQCYREPVTVKTKSGRIVVGVHAGNRLGWPERSGQDLVIRYSDDNGKSWSPLIVAAEHGNFSCQSHGLVYDAEKNRLLFLYVTYNWDYSSIKGKGGKATAPIYQKLHDEGKPAMSAYLVYSNDEGKTWSKPRDISKTAGGDAHFGASEGRQLTLGKHAGRLVIAGGDERNMTPTGKVINKNIGVWISDDHGKKWRFSQIKTNESISCEARITELPDSTLLYSVRLGNSNKGRGLASSKDGGNTWSDLKLVSALKTARSNGSLLTVRDKAGKLTRTLLQSIPRGPGTKNGTIYISQDGGKTWPKHKIIIPNVHFKYSAIVQLSPETIGFFYETNHYKDIYYKQLSISELVK